MIKLDKISELGNEQRHLEDWQTIPFVTGLIILEAKE